ncbi:hypothetical protein ACWAUC_10655 [Bradyrhizobium guangdongense]
MPGDKHRQATREASSSKVPVYPGQRLYRTAMSAALRGTKHETCKTKTKTKTKTKAPGVSELLGLKQLAPRPSWDHCHTYGRTRLLRGCDCEVLEQATTVSWLRDDPTLDAMVKRGKTHEKDFVDHLSSRGAPSPSLPMLASLTPGLPKRRRRWRMTMR